jgi:hypothetical protein
LISKKELQILKFQFLKTPNPKIQFLKTPTHKQHIRTVHRLKNRIKPPDFDPSRQKINQRERISHKNSINPLLSFKTPCVKGERERSIKGHYPQAFKSPTNMHLLTNAVPAAGAKIAM